MEANQAISRYTAWYRSLVDDERPVQRQRQQSADEMRVATKEKILFIVNPISGTQSKTGIVRLINQEISRQHFEYQIVFTQDKGHASELSRQAVDDSVEYVIAVGGDGTMNEVARGLVHTSSTLGIIPSGSGNGLARHLGIPMNTVAALRLLNRPHKICMDSCTMNDLPFFCTAGAGFDAYVGHCFDQMKTRGFYRYVQTTLREFMRYRPSVYYVKTGDRSVKHTAFLVTFANASQYGNNAYIAPQASVQDGLVDVCIIRAFPTNRIIPLGIKLFNKTLHTSPYVETIRVPEVTLERDAHAPVHLDGDPYEMGTHLTVRVLPDSLRILVP